MLHSQRLAYRARGEVLPNPTRLTKVQHPVPLSIPSCPHAVHKTYCRRPQLALRPAVTSLNAPLCCVVQQSGKMCVIKHERTLRCFAHRCGERCAG